MPSNSTILLIDHHPREIGVIRQSLAGMPVGLEVAHRGADGLRYLLGGRGKETLPCLVLLELHLPDMHGLEVLKTIRAESSTSYLPVVMLTRAASEDEVRQSYVYGANSFVFKPLEEQTLVYTVNLMCIYWTRVGVKLPQPES